MNWYAIESAHALGYAVDSLCSLFFHVTRGEFDMARYSAIDFGMQVGARDSFMAQAMEAA